MNSDFIQFFRDLASHNDRDWFHAQKKHYEASVKKPFAEFVEQLLAECRKFDPSITKAASQCIFRIHRDVRFSQDKSPYKLYASAIVSPGSYKSVEKPGMYFEFGTEHITIYGGLYAPEKEVLYRIRENIASGLEEFERILKENEFVKIYGAVKGEKNARLPKEFQEAQTKQPLIANKQFYVMAEFPVEKILSPDIVAFVADKYRVLMPLNEWLAKAIDDHPLS